MTAPIALATIATKKASAQDVGAYFFHVNVHASPDAPAVSERAAALGQAMIDTFNKSSVDDMQMLDGFIDCNHGGRGDGNGGRDSSYLGFMDNAKNLVFFNNHKAAILDLMNEVIDQRCKGDEKQYIYSLAYSNGIIDSTVINANDSSLLCAFDAMISDGSESQSAHAVLQDQLTLAVLNDVIYQSLNAYDTIVEAVDFAAG